MTDLRLLPYIWNRVNETNGVLEIRRMNFEEISTINGWAARGFLKVIHQYDDVKAHSPITDKSTMTIEVTKDFYDKMVNVLILANYISELNREVELGMSGEPLKQEEVIPVA